MRKNAFFITILFMVFSLPMEAITSATQSEVELNVYYGSPIKEGLQPRSAKSFFAGLDGQDLYFTSFDCQCTLEIVDCESRAIIFSAEIPEGATSCQIPLLSDGKYIIKFILDDMVYWGILEIENPN